MVDLIKAEEQGNLNRQLAEYVERIADRDEKSFAQFYDVTVNRVYALALRITRLPQAAEDVTEECYWQVWCQAERYDVTRGVVLAWLLTICRSRALDYLRKQDSAESCADMDELAEMEGQLASSPLDMLLVFEEKSLVNQALAELDSVQRQLVGLAFFRGMTHQEIADFIPMPLGTVKSHLRKTLQFLQGRLEKKFVERKFALKR